MERREVGEGSLRQRRNTVQKSDGHCRLGRGDTRKLFLGKAVSKDRGRAFMMYPKEHTRTLIKHTTFPKYCK